MSSYRVVANECGTTFKVQRRRAYFFWTDCRYGLLDSVRTFTDMRSAMQWATELELRDKHSHECWRSA